MRKGINLIEIIIIIVVAGIAIPPLFLSLSDVTQRSTEGELYYQAMLLGRDLMEEILSNSFDNITICTDAASCPYSDTVEGYRRDVIVNWVNPDQSPSGCLNGTQIYALDCYKGSPTNYKRIDVTVSHNLINDLNFTYIVYSGHTAK
jgi:hypothetical protein